MNKYIEMKKRHEQEFNAWTDGKMFFAFNEKQFNEGMREIGLKPNETGKICRGPAGGFLRKDAAAEFVAMMKRHSDEMRNAIAADHTGEGFIYQAIFTELVNHEYCITCDPEDALNALGISAKDIAKNPAIAHGLKLAKDAAMRDGE